MASSENLASIQPWIFGSNSADSWISDAFARDTDTLTKALQKSLAGVDDSDNFLSDSISPFFDLFKPDTTPTPAVSGVSGGSEPETAPVKSQRNSIPVSSGKVSKRKPRTSKRSQTTFITADPANFRQMVQQVTGVSFSNSQVSLPTILKPEPHRAGSRLTGVGCLPTLDTSAFFLDHQQKGVVGPNTTAGVGSGLNGPAGPLGFASSVGVADGAGAGAVAGGGLDFDTFSSFPTLESWKVV